MANHNGSAETVLDHLDQIRVSGDVFRDPANEYWALLWLRDGMRFLARQVETCEEAVRQNYTHPSNLQVFAAGNLPEFSRVPMTLVTCAFHWYSISACQYARTVGMIAESQDGSRPKALAYVENVLPEVKAFRDKVAAHFAWGTSNEKDSPAERVASIIPGIAWQNDRFVVAPYRVSVVKGGKHSDSREIYPWSLTDIHAKLCARYWPDTQSTRQCTPTSE